MILRAYPFIHCGKTLFPIGCRVFIEITFNIVRIDWCQSEINRLDPVFPAFVADVPQITDDILRVFPSAEAVRAAHDEEIL